METLKLLLDQTHMAWLSALLMGLITALSPCPLATNIATIGYLSKNIDSKRQVLLSGLFYTLGRVFSYTMLAWLLMIIVRGGANVLGVHRFLSLWGERLTGPIMLLMGVVLLVGEHLRLPTISLWKQRTQAPTLVGAFFMGCVFALAFCPTAGVLYFGGLLPMALSTTGGWLLPLLFATTTALPVVLVSFILAFGMQNIGRVMGKIQAVQRIFQILVAVLFISIGGYYIIVQILL